MAPSTRNTHHGRNAIGASVQGLPPSPVAAQSAEAAASSPAVDENEPLDTVSISVELPGDTPPPSARLVEVGLRFGVPLAIEPRTIATNLKLKLRPGTLTLITGPSGSGKSQILAAVARRFPTSRLVNDLIFPQDVAVLDAVAPTRPVYEALSVLTACGLGEPRLWIRRFGQLSDGERFRARLSRAVSLQQRHHLATPLLCDEFGAILHRRLAKAIAFNLRKLVTREKLCLVVATSQHDIEGDLHADQVVRLGRKEPILEHLADRGQHGPLRPSFAQQMRIDSGSARDYEHFAAMHYRRGSHLGFVDKVFVMRDRLSDEPMGIVVYGHAALELSLRNRITGGRFVRRPARLNRELRVLKRLVIHPDIRGCGLAHWLVERTLPLVGKPFVECLAAMSAINPVFDKAGMRRIGTIPAPPTQEKTLHALRTAGADPLAADFVTQVCRRPAIRRLVTSAVLGWYRGTTSSEERTAQMSPLVLTQTFRQIAGSQPVYFIWANDERGWKIIDRHTEND